MRDAIEEGFDNVEGIESKEDFALAIDDLLCENFEWSFEDDPTKTRSLPIFSLPDHSLVVVKYNNNITLIF